MKTHQRWEWITAGNASYTGDSPADIYSQLNPEDAKEHTPEELLAIFQKKEDAGDGSWKWYDSLIGEKWRFDPNRNDLVRRIGGGRGRRRNPQKLRESAKKNLAVSHERRRVNHEQAVEIARKGQAALQAKQTPEDVANRMKRMREKKAEAMTPERRAEINRRISEAKKAAIAARKAQQEQQETSEQ